MKQLALFDADRLPMAGAIELTAASLREYGARHRHWVSTYSGGKDSSTATTIIHHLIEAGRVPRPDSLTVLYADTRLELPPLHATAMHLLARLEALGVRTRVVAPPMDHRFFVYMLGRGVPPPGARFRWCTGIMKLQPMNAALLELREAHGPLLVLTGVREGESAARDGRIALSCSRDGSECGQGRFYHDAPAGVGSMLAPLIHWRVCHVWDWLTFYAPGYGYPTELVAEAYGGNEAEEINARTGCVGCPVASRDKALEAVVGMPRWAYLRPLLRLRELWPLLRAPERRHRKTDERRKDGSLIKGGNRLGPLTFEARLFGLDYVLGVQAEVNAGRGEMPRVELINPEEEARIREQIAAGTMPNGWDGDEVVGDEWLEAGAVPLFGL